MMNDRPSGGQARAGSGGLCDRCVHLQVVISARGSRFYLCRLSITDPRFPKYPAIPVVTCSGFAAAGAEDEC